MMGRFSDHAGTFYDRQPYGVREWAELCRAADDEFNRHRVRRLLRSKGSGRTTQSRARSYAAPYFPENVPAPALYPRLTEGQVSAQLERFECWLSGQPEVSIKTAASLMLALWPEEFSGDSNWTLDEAERIRTENDCRRPMPNGYRGPEGQP